MISLQMIRDIVGRYLDHPRRYNAGLEQFLFSLINWFIYAVQVWERGRVVEAVQAQIDAADNPEVKLHLRAVIEKVQSAEYIIEVPERT